MEVLEKPHGNDTTRITIYYYSNSVTNIVMRFKKLYFLKLMKIYLDVST